MAKRKEEEEDRRGKEVEEEEGRGKGGRRRRRKRRNPNKTLPTGKCRLEPHRSVSKSPEAIVMQTPLQPLVCSGRKSLSRWFKDMS